MCLVSHYWDRGPLAFCLASNPVAAVMTGEHFSQEFLMSSQGLQPHMGRVAMSSTYRTLPLASHFTASGGRKDGVGGQRERERDSELN
jgi:molybdopterin biosynthesis enzyme